MTVDDDQQDGESLPARLRRYGNHPAIGYLAWLLAAVYLLLFVTETWMPHDEGTLSHSAERTFHGETPHRDFDDSYTGGLTYWNVLSFHIFGVKLSSIRWLLYLTALAWLACFYWIASRHTERWIAGLLLWVATAWSLPNYFAALPTWYLLFTATFGVACVLRFLDTGHLRWLFAAGLCGGVGILFKIHAVFYIGGVLLFLVFHERESAATARRESTTRHVATAVLASGIAIAFLLLVLALIHRHIRPMEIATYVIPIGLLCSLLVVPEWHRLRGDVGRTLRRLSVLSAGYLAGVTLPLVVFVLHFAAQRAVDDLYAGVLVLPQRFVSGQAPAAASAEQPSEEVPGLKRFLDGVSSMSLPAIVWLLPALPLALILAAGLGDFRKWDRRLATVLAIIGMLVLCVLAVALSARFRNLLGSEQQAFIYRLFCFSARSLYPLASVVIVLICYRANAASKPRQELFLLAIVTAVMTLLQYPYATAIYFFYVAPLVLLALNAAVSLQPTALRRTLLVCLAFYLAFGVGWLNTGYNRSHGVQYLKTPATEPLQLERAGIRVSQQHRLAYETVAELVRRHSTGDEAILAGPDCPELYFLCERRNSTRALFDLFLNPVTEAEEIIDYLDQHRIRVVVINQEPEFSVKVGPELNSLLQARFPQRQVIDKFVVMWRKSVPLSRND